MSKAISFLCSACGREYPIETLEFRCRCGGSFKLNWTSRPIPISSLRQRGTSIWRYREALPISEDRNIISLGEGFTPLIPFVYRDFEKMFLKLDYLCPTGSFKDRGSSVLISKLKELGISTCVEDSSGNAGASIAAYTARAGIQCRIYCPADTSEGKLVQIKAYGAELAKIPGSRAETAAVVQEEARKCYYASHNWNPFFGEGVKTLAFEICEQLGWKVPGAIICPTGYGSINLGLYKGFKELLEQAIVNRLPRLIGVQAEAVSPIYRAFSQRATEVNEVQSEETMAEGIACVRPIRGKEILQIAHMTGGGFEAVSEREILEGWKELSGQGIYVEPTSGVVVKAIDRLVHKGLLNRQETNVLVLTGTGLKATEKLLGYVNA